MDNLCAMLSKCNLVENPRKWWMNSGASHHVCANKELFSTLSPAQVEERIYMTNSAIAKVEETGKVCLKMTFGKVLTLNNVLYVPELRKNLISVSLLEKNGFKCVFISEKIILSKGEVYSLLAKLVAPVCIHCDNQEAIGRARSMMNNDKSHHIRRRYNTIRELSSSEIITVDYVKSKDNVSDPFTKGLSREGVEITSKGMSLRPRTSQHDGNST
ncbi:hypothetical protein CQW23_06186 [Capsicum baccatum]|uniref:Retrovirus-related Pol polyprotein from transposon TNT 1-94-like beta-barrel domain-containing protein n=1 Tax=Capsicum baccatum TaxID=33114 RepID=A0A2G2X2K7_CAPBA|nr:hypothetical protein CQW23_06186 [Capsicum baccatum]